MNCTHGTITVQTVSRSCLMTLTGMDGHNEVEAWSLESEGINESLLLENNNEHR